MCEDSSASAFVKASRFYDVDRGERIPHEWSWGPRWDVGADAGSQGGSP